MIEQRGGDYGKGSDAVSPRRIKVGFLVAGRVGLPMHPSKSMHSDDLDMIWSFEHSRFDLKFS